MTSLKQIPIEKRILFLKKFTTEIISNIIKEKLRKEKIEQEKINQKILSPIKEPIAPSFKTFQPSKFPQIKAPEYEKIPLETTIQKKSKNILELRKPILHRIRSKRLMPSQIKKQPQFKQSLTNQKIPAQEQQKPVIPPKIKALKEITPKAEPRPEGFALGKIEALLKNNTIQSIECPGPNKNLLIKRYDKINTTKITITQEEITDILYNFAKEAKIPIVGGILKAAVGDLVISAVISEFVGSRFIINKITPYSIIKK